MCFKKIYGFVCVSVVCAHSFVAAMGDSDTESVVASSPSGSSPVQEPQDLPEVHKFRKACASLAQIVEEALQKATRSSLRSTDVSPSAAEDSSFNFEEALKRVSRYLENQRQKKEAKKQALKDEVRKLKKTIKEYDDPAGFGSDEDTSSAPSRAGVLYRKNFLGVELEQSMASSVESASKLLGKLGLEGKTSQDSDASSVESASKFLEGLGVQPTSTTCGQDAHAFEGQSRDSDMSSVKSASEILRNLGL